MTVVAISCGVAFLIVLMLYMNAINTINHLREQMRQLQAFYERLQEERYFESGGGGMGGLGVLIILGLVVFLIVQFGR